MQIFFEVEKTFLPDVKGSNNWSLAALAAAASRSYLKWILVTWTLIKFWFWPQWRSPRRDSAEIELASNEREGIGFGIFIGILNESLHSGENVVLVKHSPLKKIELIQKYCMDDSPSALLIRYLSELIVIPGYHFLVKSHYVKSNKFFEKGGSTGGRGSAICPKNSCV